MSSLNLQLSPSQQTQGVTFCALDTIGNAAEEAEKEEESAVADVSEVSSSAANADVSQSTA